MGEREQKGEKKKISLLKLALMILGIIAAIAISITISLKFPVIL